MSHQTMTLTTQVVFRFIFQKMTGFIVMDMNISLSNGLTPANIEQVSFSISSHLTHWNKELSLRLLKKA